MSEPEQFTETSDAISRIVLSALTEEIRTWLDGDKVAFHAIIKKLSEKRFIEMAVQEIRQSECK